MKLEISITELEQICKSIVAENLILRINNESKLSVSYDLPIIRNFSIDLEIYDVKEGVIYIKSSTLIKKFSSTITKSIIPGLITENENGLAIDLNKIEKISYMLDDVNLTKIEASNESQLVAIELSPNISELMKKLVPKEEK